MSGAPRPVLVGIDGRSGAGKSTLASALAARLAPAARVAILPLQDLYPGWDGLAAALAPEGPYPRAVRALAAGRAARWRSWDWHRSGPGPERVLDPAGVDLTGRDVTVTIDLKAGESRATVWTNDLTHAYVHENSAYSS